MAASYRRLGLSEVFICRPILTEAVDGSTARVSSQTEADYMHVAEQTKTPGAVDKTRKRLVVA